MIIKKSFWIGSILINLLGILYLRWLFSQNFNGLFGGFFESIFFFVFLFIYSFIHLFIYSKLKEKVIICFIDLIPAIILIFSDAIRDSDTEVIIPGIILLYILPAFIISLLSLGIQKLWRKARKRVVEFSVIWKLGKQVVRMD